MSALILGDSAPIRELMSLIHRVANTKTNILVIGESGTGKELVARMIHQSGPLKDKPFVPVNCGAIPETLIETEMFGHHKGSFTGAVADKAGLFEMANGGTLFLDEVGELPLSMQVKLLRAIQERKFRKVGGVTDVTVDVRIIAATNRDLEAAVAKGSFREDLFYRLNVILIKTPPLRERPGDVQILAERFLKTFAQRAKKAIHGFLPEALQALEGYRWPGNVRELENVIERAVTLQNGEEIELQSLPLDIQKFGLESVGGAGSSETLGVSAGARNSTTNLAQSVAGGAADIRLPAPDFTKGKLDLDKILGDVERIYLMAAMTRAGGVKKKAADLLGITFRSIRYRLTKLGM